MRLAQIIVNLLSNASRVHSRARAHSVGGAQNNQEMWICVSDTGIGLKVSDFQRVFQTFEQVESRIFAQGKGDRPWTGIEQESRGASRRQDLGGE